MPKRLTTEQVDALKAVPLGDMPNKLRIALALTKTKQADIVDATGIPASNVSNIVNGKYDSLHLETAQKFAVFFGCGTDDLFPTHGVAA